MSTQPKVLLVDDEPRILSALTRRLSTDFDVVAFEKPAEALDYIKSSENLSVIVADMRMPEMSGLELLRASQACKPGIKRIMLTGNSDQKTAIDAINHGNVYRFLRKPCDAEVVKNAIQSAIEDTQFSEASIDELAAKMAEQRGTKPEAQNMFLSVMSEELRTPLSQVITISDTLNDRTADYTERTKARMLRQIGESGKKALCQVDRILTFVKLQSQTIVPKEFETVDIAQILKQEINSFRTEAGERDVTLSVEVEEKYIPIISLRENVKTAIRETLANAVKFNKSSGHISVQLISNGTRAALRISNSGPKLPGSKMTGEETVFKDSDFELNRENYGIGLGLSLIKTAAASGGFKCDLWPRPTGGAWMTFVFKCNH